MKHVYLYGGAAKFDGSGSFEWHGPDVGSTHKLILFLSQDTDEPRQDLAIRELACFGFCEIQIGVGKPIHVEALNDPQMHAFQRHYEGAIEDGCSVVWYP
ncbi:hypothetical protein V8J88_21385 [Massilia sp. W12]|uniref:hypothetical protein n=1 Tax=Massilia sp. W12 TaxID=3126507 RepID=UPI0030D48678